MSRSDRVAWWILTFGGSGTAPAAPGTAGSLAALGVAALLRGGVGIDSPWLFPALALAMGALHIAVGGRIPRLFGRLDPPAVVSDEACGLWLVFSVPLPADTPWWPPLLLGFLLFRILDIAKPLGIRKLDRIPGKWGVLLDDLLAGAYAGVVLWGFGSTGALAGLDR
jgi:phosphatidylglycerophosphatase A